MLSDDFINKFHMYQLLRKLDLKDENDGAIYYAPGVYMGLYIGGGLT